MVTVPDLIAKEMNTIKEVMHIIDRSGLGIALITDNKDVLLGTITDGDIRKALGKGFSINTKASEIMNSNPIFLKIGEGKKEIKEQLEKRGKQIVQFYVFKIPVVDSVGRPINLAIYPLNTGNLSYITEKGFLPNHGVKTVLVVGGAGYLGSILSRKLLEKGYHVNVLDKLLFGDASVAELKPNSKFELIPGDIRDISVLTKALKDADAVIHLAAIVGDPATKNQPEDTIETNYLATVSLAQACKYHQINRLIFASTCSVYGISP